MQGLGLCLWLVCSKSHPWTSIVREVAAVLELKSACRPHVRIRSGLKISTAPEAPQKTRAEVVGGLFMVTTEVSGWPPLHTIELPLRLDTDENLEDLLGETYKDLEDVHISLAHRFGVEPFTPNDVSNVKQILHNYSGWKVCFPMRPALANMRKPDPATWRDISP